MEKEKTTKEIVIFIVALTIIVTTFLFGLLYVNGQGIDVMSGKNFLADIGNVMTNSDSPTTPAIPVPIPTSTSSASST